VLVESRIGEFTQGNQIAGLMPAPQDESRPLDRRRRCNATERNTLRNQRLAFAKLSVLSLIDHRSQDLGARFECCRSNPAQIEQ